MLNHVFAWLFSFHGFSISSKTNISKFQFNQESGRRRITVWMCYLEIIIYLFYSFYYSITKWFYWVGGVGGGGAFVSLERWDALLALFLHGYVMYTKRLPEENIIHVLIIEWTYSSWYKNKCFVLSWYHILLRTAVSKCYVSFFKILYHRMCKVSMTTNKAQNAWNIRSKVSEETCWSARLPYQSGHETNNSKSFNTGVFLTPVKKIGISGRTKI